jgi:Rrf2 family protein
MKLGSKGYYGLLALTELASRYSTQAPVQVKEIAQRQGVPEEYLGQIMAQLTRSRIVHGTRGPAGGYLLARPPGEITVGEVLRILEGQSNGLEMKSARRNGRSPSAQPKIMKVWERATDALRKVLDEASIEDLCRREDQAYMYYI